MSKIKLTSDLHLGHDKEFLYGKRGFNTISAHDATVLANLRQDIEEGDELYILGDIVMGADDEYRAANLRALEELPCKIHIVLGNHDTDQKIEQYQKMKNVVEVAYGIRLKYGHHMCFLSHYPTVTSNEFDAGKPFRHIIINLYGHTHQTEFFYQGNTAMYNVGLDAHNMHAVDLDQVIEEVRIAHNGFNE